MSNDQTTHASLPNPNNEPTITLPLSAALCLLDLSILGHSFMSDSLPEFIPDDSPKQDALLTYSEVLRPTAASIPPYPPAQPGQSKTVAQVRSQIPMTSPLSIICRALLGSYNNFHNSAIPEELSAAIISLGPLPPK
jgi:hypothetical protein